MVKFFWTAKRKRVSGKLPPPIKLPLSADVVLKPGQVQNDFYFVARAFPATVRLVEVR
jgi:hypothetical protein